MRTKWSRDGQWWWDGQRWIAAAALRRPVATLPPPAPDALPAPSPQLLTFGALACLGLALASYPLLFSHWALFGPPAEIIAIAIGRAARHSLPKTAMRDRGIAGLGMILAGLPLALIIIGILAIQLILLVVLVTGIHSIG